MKREIHIFFTTIVFFAFGFSVFADPLSGSTPPEKLLFDDDTILEIHLSGEIGKIRKDRGKDKTFHPVRLIYFDKNGSQTSMDVEVRTRGIFRLNPRICNFPPLQLKFKKKDVKKTIFNGIKRLKMVTHCQDRKKLYQKFVVREYLAYKLFNLFTEKSFRVRLARLTYIDAGRKNKEMKKYAFFIEPVEMMAARNHCRYLKIDPTTQYTLDSKQSSFLSFFQFLIGNTDWSYTADHNVKRIVPDGGGPTIGVPYDFDFSGIVGTPYAVPAEVAKTTSTKDRYFQGFCQPMEVFEEIFDRFREQKENIYALYATFPLLDKKYKKTTRKFLDGFYKIINNPRLVKRYIYKSCVEKTIKQ